MLGDLDTVATITCHISSFVFRDPVPFETLFLDVSKLSATAFARFEATDSILKDLAQVYTCSRA